MKEPNEELVLFYEEQTPRLRGTLALYCGDRDLASELAQEAMARVCLHWKKVRELPDPAAWAHRVGFNLANSYFRRLAAERRARSRARSPDRSIHTDPDSASAVAVRHALRQLPRRQRAALVLRYYGDLSVAATAQAMDCPEGTVKTLTAKAIAALRALIHDDEEVADAIRS